MEARWLPGVVEGPQPVRRGKITVRIERYAVNNGGNPLYFVRAELGGAERTLSLKFEQFRALHRRLAEDAGVLYTTNQMFPKPLRKARLGLRMTPAEMSEQCDALNLWLRGTTDDIDELPLASQSEVRQFLGFEGAEPPPWTTAKAATGGGLFSAKFHKRKPTTKKIGDAVYPLGDSATLPGVTRRGRLECQDGHQWLSVHVILTHLSLLVFQPVDDPGSPTTKKPNGAAHFAAAAAAAKSARESPKKTSSPVGSPKSVGFRGLVGSPTNRQETERSSFGGGAPTKVENTPRKTSFSSTLTSPNSNVTMMMTRSTSVPSDLSMISAAAEPIPFAAAFDVRSSRNDSTETHDPEDTTAVASAILDDQIATKAAEKTTVIDKENKASSAGRLLHNLHVTDILSIVRHGDSETMSAPPIHHRCFTIGDLNDESVCLRAVNARDCIQWLKAIARAKDRALAAVHRLDDKSHGHELVLATMKFGDDSERIVARGHRKGPGYGWFEPFRVPIVAPATLRFELNAGALELPVTSLLARAAADAGNGLGPATSAAAAEAAANLIGTTRGAFWATVALDNTDDDVVKEKLQILVAVDASEALEKGAQRRRDLDSRRPRIVARYVRSGIRSVSKLVADHGLPKLRAALASRPGALAIAALACFLVAKFGGKNDDHLQQKNKEPTIVFTTTENHHHHHRVVLPAALFSESDALLVLLVRATTTTKGEGRLIGVVDVGRLGILCLLWVFGVGLIAVYLYSSATSEDSEEETREDEDPAVVDALGAATETSTIDVRLVNWRWRHHKKPRVKPIEEPQQKEEYFSKPAEEVERLPPPIEPTKPRWQQVWAMLRGKEKEEVTTTTTTVEFLPHETEEDARKEEDLIQARTTSKDMTNRKSMKIMDTFSDEALPEEFDDDDDDEEEEELPTDVPLRFLGAVRGDRTAAKKRWAETTAFRQNGNRPEDVIQRPQPYFHRIKARHRHFIHKRDKLGHILAFEVVDNPNRAFKDLAGDGVTPDDVAAHMHFVSAFTYVKLLDDVDEVGKKPKDPEGYFLKVIDLKHIGLGDCGGETARYFRLVAAINRHYPERVWKTIIINAPSVFGVIWTIVSPLLEPNVREKITVLRSNYKDTLRDLVDPDDLPVEYGGNDPDPSPQEIALASFADMINAKYDMSPTLPTRGLGVTAPAALGGAPAKPPKRGTSVPANLDDISSSSSEPPPPSAAAPTTTTTTTEGGSEVHHLTPIESRVISFESSI